MNWDDLQNEASEIKSENIQMKQALASSSYQQQDDNNLIQHQLETSEMLSKIEHFLKGETMGIDADGNEDWIKQENDELVLFNEYGVNSIMLIIGNYIDKNTILSRYDEMRINEILADLGDELSRFIFCNYEMMGMDTEFKKTRFQLTVITILHSVESAYRRALGGKTMEDLNSSRIVTQTDPLGNSLNGIAQKKRFSLFKPTTW